MRRVRGEGLRSYPGRPGGRPEGSPRREARLSRQESAEAIVPEDREGPNIKLGVHW
jgi:hypothetical protein